MSQSIQFAPVGRDDLRRHVLPDREGERGKPSQRDGPDEGRQREAVHRRAANLDGLREPDGTGGRDRHHQRVGAGEEPADPRPERVRLHDEAGDFVWIGVLCRCHCRRQDGAGRVAERVFPAGGERPDAVLAVRECPQPLIDREPVGEGLRQSRSAVNDGEPSRRRECREALHAADDLVADGADGRRRDHDEAPGQWGGRSGPPEGLGDHSGQAGVAGDDAGDLIGRLLPPRDGRPRRPWPGERPTPKRSPSTPVA
jgi:hypothetical protein